MKDNLGNFQHQTAQDLLSKEIYDIRFNKLVHGLDENENNAWETKWKSEAQFRGFLLEALEIPETYSIAIADVHRFPQHPISKEGKSVTQPIIAKLTSYSDKNLIMRNLKNLKLFNEDRRN